MTDSNRRRPASRPALLVAAALLSTLLGCASTRNQAPVEDRGAAARANPRVVAEVPKPAASAAGQTTTTDVKAGTYVVKPGDTLMRIALDSGQSWRDVARWNNIENPNLIEVGQVLRVVPPTAADMVAQARPAPAPKVDAKPLDPKASTAGANPSAGASAASTAGPQASAPAPAPAPAPQVTRDVEDDIPWAWPAAGPVLTPFDDSRTKGLGIGGKAGDPVLAAADGRVVYAGSGLRGYGNLVIVKHNATYLTAYAHNQTLLVKEDQTVRKGQKIAEMGSTDSDKVQLHFEIRRQGKPIDPAKLLPAR